jgi:hypothetical protein
VVSSSMRQSWAYICGFHPPTQYRTLWPLSSSQC